MYKVPDGVSYNSYVIVDEKIAVLDTADAHFGKEWLYNVREALGGRQPDYLVIHHMEPDHSANIQNFLKEYPNVQVVGNTKTFTMIKEYFGFDVNNSYKVEEGSILNLGRHSLRFVMAPLVHWPEVMVSYDELSGIVFSADAFGKFGALDVNQPWDDEARRYYIGIVGKYGVQVQNLLKKLSALNIKKFAPCTAPCLKATFRTISTSTIRGRLTGPKRTRLWWLTPRYTVIQRPLQKRLPICSKRRAKRL